MSTEGSGLIARADSKTCRLPATSCRLVVIRAAQVVAAARAHQLALVLRQAMRTRGANLAMMIHWRLIGVSRTNLNVQRRIRRNFVIEDAGPLGKHGSEITIELNGYATSHRGHRPTYPKCNAAIAIS